MSDYITFNMWVFMFMRNQGYDILNNILFQDNNIAISTKKLINW